MLAPGILVIGALLLVLSGSAKILGPEPTRGALAAVGLPSGRSAVMVLGVIEVAVGATAALTASRLAVVAMTMLYVGFAGFVAVALARDVPVQSCGCFGKEDTPPSIAHLVVNGAIAAAAGWSVASGSAGVLERLADDLATGTVFLGFAGLGVWLLYLLLAELPKTLNTAGVTR